jgi:hypothetical protein
MFKQASTEPMSSFIFQTTKQKIGDKSHKAMTMDKEQKVLRKSPRLKVKDTKVKKCGIVEEEKQLYSRTLQQYLDMYKQSLSEESLEAIIKLSEVAVEKKKKKKEKKKIDKPKTQDTVKEGIRHEKK